MTSLPRLDKACAKGASANLLHPTLAAASALGNSLFGPIVETFPGWTRKPAVTAPRLDIQSLSQDANATARNLFVRACGLLQAQTGVGSLQQQGTIHELYGASGAHDPKNGRFLAWHRAFIFFHERLLRWHLEQKQAANADQVRVPYWNVVDFGPQDAPSLYKSEAALSNSNCRTFIPEDSADIDPAKKSLSLGLAAPTLSQASAGIFYWHNFGHDFAGGNMADLATAAYDPLFFAWHSNVDRWWATSATEAADMGLDDYCAFFDPYTNANGGWVKVNLRDFTSIRSLGYTYARPMHPFLPAAQKGHILQATHLPLPEGHSGKFEFLLRPPEGEEKSIFRILNLTHQMMGSSGMNMDHGNELALVQIPLEEGQPVPEGRGLASPLYIRARDTGAERQIQDFVAL